MLLPLEQVISPLKRLFTQHHFQIQIIEFSVQSYDGSGDRTNFQIMVGSTGYVEFGHSSTVQTNAGLVGTNKWYHIAMTREWN